MSAESILWNVRGYFTNRYITHAGKGDRWRWNAQTITKTLYDKLTGIQTKPRRYVRVVVSKYLLITFFGLGLNVPYEIRLFIENQFALVDHTVFAWFNGSIKGELKQRAITV